MVAKTSCMKYFFLLLSIIILACNNTPKLPEDPSPPRDTVIQKDYVNQFETNLGTLVLYRTARYKHPEPRHSTLSLTYDEYWTEVQLRDEFIFDFYVSGDPEIMRLFDSISAAHKRNWKMLGVPRWIKTDTAKYYDADTLVHQTTKKIRY